MDNKELEGLLLYAGVGIFVLFLFFSLLSVWWNGIICSWLSVKYFFLMGAAALTLMLEDSARRRYAIAFAAFMGLLFYADQVTFKGDIGSLDGKPTGQLVVLATADLEDLKEEQKELEEKASRKEQREEIEELQSRLRHLIFKPNRIDRSAEYALVGEKKDEFKFSLTDEQLKGRALEKSDFVDEDDWDDIKDKRKDLESDLKEKLEQEQKVENKIEKKHLVQRADLEQEVKEERDEAAEQLKNLMWAKGYDAFVLLGAFFMLAGALIGGAPESESSYYDYSTTYGASTYTPPATTTTPASTASSSAAAETPKAEAKPEAPKAAEKPADEAKPADDKPAEGGAAAT